MHRTLARRISCNMRPDGGEARRSPSEGRRSNLAFRRTQRVAYRSGKAGEEPLFPATVAMMTAQNPRRSRDRPPEWSAVGMVAGQPGSLPAPDTPSRRDIRREKKLTVNSGTTRLLASWWAVESSRQNERLKKDNTITSRLHRSEDGSGRIPGTSAKGISATSPSRASHRSVSARCRGRTIER